MSSQEQDRYTLTLDDGTRWRYDPSNKGYPWHVVQSGNVRHRTPDRDGPLTPPELRRAADIVERWEQDHKPKVRLRVVEGALGRYWIWIHGAALAYATTESARCAFGPLVLTDLVSSDLDALISLRAHPYEVSHDGGATWTPCATEEGR